MVQNIKLIRKPTVFHVFPNFPALKKNIFFQHFQHVSLTLGVRCSPSLPDHGTILTMLRMFLFQWTMLKNIAIIRKATVFNGILNFPAFFIERTRIFSIFSIFCNMGCRMQPKPKEKGKERNWRGKEKFRRKKRKVKEKNNMHVYPLLWT